MRRGVKIVTTFIKAVRRKARGVVTRVMIKTWKITTREVKERIARVTA